MHPSELRMGDIILFHTKCQIPGILAIKHVAIFTGHIEGVPYATHCVVRSGPDVGYSPNDGVETTVLKEIEDCMGGRVEVFRPTNAELGERAAQRMLQWASYKVPYDKMRAKWMQETSIAFKEIGIKKNIEPLDYLLECLEKEAKIKFYEQIKFAARRETCPVKMLKGVQPRGFTCVQAVILAYQVEELVPFVKPLSKLQKELEPLAQTQEEIDEIWISDKHCPEENIDDFILPDSYVEYCNLLRDSEEFGFPLQSDKRNTPTHPHYHPSLVAWDYEKEPDIDAFREKFDSCLKLPAKICFTDGLYAFMNKNPRHWSKMGTLNNEYLKLTFSIEAKTLHRQVSSSLAKQIQETQEDVSRMRTLSSPGPRSGSSSPRRLSLERPGMLKRVSSLGIVGEQVLGDSRQEVTSPLLSNLYPARANLSR